MKRKYKRYYYEVHTYVLQCTLCTHIWSIVLQEPTSNDIAEAAKSNKHCPVCMSIDIRYAGESISTHSKAG